MFQSNVSVAAPAVGRYFLAVVATNLMASPKPYVEKSLQDLRTNYALHRAFLLNLVLTEPFLRVFKQLVLNYFNKLEDLELFMKQSVSQVRAASQLSGGTEVRACRVKPVRQGTTACAVSVKWLLAFVRT